MALQELFINDENSNREKLSFMPLNKEFKEDLSEITKHTLNKDGTLTLKNRLVMREGEHNDVYYSWDELKQKYLTGEGAGLFYDHEDSVQNYAGLIKNLKLNEATKEIFGDVHVTNKQSALDISLGAKWGISPTIDAEKVLKDGKKHAIDPNFLSYSLVLRPAVRETMLNSERENARKEDIQMEGKERELFELAADVKAKEKKIQELENEAKESEKKVEESEKKVEDANKKIEESEKKESDKEAEDLCALEGKIGFTTEAEQNTRLEELKNMSAESRSHLKSAHEKYVKVLKLGEGEEDDNGEALAQELKEGFMAFREKMLKSNPKATSQEIKVAYSESLSQTKTNEGVDNEDLSQIADPQKRMKAELASKAASEAKVNSNILAYMKEQERK